MKRIQQHKNIAVPLNSYHLNFFVFSDFAKVSESVLSNNYTQIGMALHTSNMINIMSLYIYVGTGQFAFC